MSDQAAPATPAPEAPASTEQASQTEAKQPTADDDPELDFGDLKVKKSEAAKRLKQHEEIIRGSNKKFEEAAKMRKQVESFVGALQQDTITALKQAGLTKQQIVKLAEQVLSEEIEQARLSPEELEARETKAERDRLKKEAEERAENDRKAAEAHEVAQYEQYFEKAFIGAIERKGLDRDTDTVQRMAHKVDALIAEGTPLNQIDLDELADQIAEEDENRWQQRLSKWDAPTLAKRLGARVEDVRKVLLEAAGGQPKRPEPEQTREERPRGPRKKITEFELKQLVKQRIGG